MANKINKCAHGVHGYPHSVSPSFVATFCNGVTQSGDKLLKYPTKLFIHLLITCYNIFYTFWYCINVIFICGMLNWQNWYSNVCRLDFNTKMYMLLPCIDKNFIICLHHEDFGGCLYVASTYIHYYCLNLGEIFSPSCIF